MSRAQLFAAFFFAVFLYLLYQFYLVLQVFLAPLAWAGVLALVFYPLHRWLTRALRQREALAAFLLTTAVIAIVMVPMAALSASIAAESVAAYGHIRDLLQAGQVPDLIAALRASRLGLVWDALAPQLERWNVDLAALVLKSSDALSGFLVGGVSAAAANVARFLINFFFATFALFFFFRDGERMVSGLRELLPMEAKHTDVILGRLYDTLSAVVQGTLATAVVQGFLAGVGFWVLGVPFALLLGSGAALLSLLPFGAPVVWLSVVVYLTVEAAYVKALILFLYGALIISGVDNVVRPLIIGGRTQIPTVFLFFGILGGVQVYGLLGIFLGPVLIAILVAFVRIYREEYASA